MTSFTRIIPTLVFLLIGFNSLASSDSQLSIGGRMMAFIVLVVLVIVFVSFIVSAVNPPKKKGDNSLTIFVIVLIAIPLLLIRGCLE
jgi:hypothetical protein